LPDGIVSNQKYRFYLGPWNGNVWYILWPFGIYYGYLVHFWPFSKLVAIWCIFPRFGILCQEKSGNPALLCLLINGALMIALKLKLLMDLGP
jgi:hypothetical protein